MVTHDCCHLLYFLNYGSPKAQNDMYRKIEAWNMMTGRIWILSGNCYHRITTTDRVPTFGNALLTMNIRPNPNQLPRPLRKLSASGQQFFVRIQGRVILPGGPFRIGAAGISSAEEEPVLEDSLSEISTWTFSFGCAPTILTFLRFAKMD